MNEREIIDGTSGGITQIKCNHCNGTGKCNCMPCSKEEDYEEYNCIFDGNPDITFYCSRCNGYGFLLLKQDGSIIVPKVK